MHTICTNQKNIAAFTLIELTLVLLVVGLAIGGVVAGQNMIRNAELRKIPLAIEDTRKQILVFYDKFNALPGDFHKAEMVWGTECTGCNGDFSGFVGRQTGNIYDEHFNEYFAFWRHLQLAELVDGDFTGTTGPWSVAHAIVGQNIPEIYNRIGINVFWQNNETNPSQTDRHVGKFGQVLLIGQQPPNWGWLNQNPTFSPEDALSIDLKIDDGMPFTGTLYGNGAGQGVNYNGYELCTTAARGDADNTNAEYDISIEDPACFFIVRNVFPKQ